MENGRKSSHEKYFHLLLILFSLFHASTGLECYACSATTEDSTCELDPSQVTTGETIIECNQSARPCCIIHRQEANENLGKVKSLFRGCQANCSVDNFLSLIGPLFRDYYTHCSKPLCNGKLGNEPLEVPDPNKRSSTSEGPQEASSSSFCHSCSVLLSIALFSLFCPLLTSIQEM